MVGEAVILVLGGGFGCVCVRSLCWLGRIVLMRLVHGKLLGLLLLRMISKFGLCLRR